MAIITGFDNTDSSSIGSKFYLGKITEQENIGSRDSDGNPIPYYSSGDIGTLQSSVILQKFDENEFKGPEVTPNTNWTNYLNQLTDTVNFLTNPISFSWTSALDDRQLEINFVTKILDDLWDDIVQVVFPNGFTLTGPFSQFYWISVKDILATHASSTFGLLGNANDTKTALEEIQASKSFVEMASSIDTRLFNERTVQGDNNLYKLVNQAYGRDYDSAQRAFSQSFTDFDRIYSFILSQGSNIDLLLGEGASSSSKVFVDFSTNSSYKNLTSGVIGNFNLITGLNLTGIQGFPTGYVSGQYLQANETGLEFVPIDDPVFDFTGLTDTPSNITSVKFVRGNQAGDGLEFTGVKFLEDVDDRPSTPITSGYLQLTDQNTLVWNPVAPGGGDVTYNFTGSEYFTGLKDTPSGYELNKFLRSTHVGIEYADINNGLVSFTGLSDTPSSFTADKFLKINNAANAVEYVDIPSPSVDFTGLNDTPASYINSSGKYLRINNTENSVEFIDISGEISSQEISWNSYLRRGDLPNASNHPGMFAYVSIDELGGNSGSAYIAHGNDWVQIFPTVPNFSFSGLVDTPASYIGSSGKFVKVSDDESRVEYANLPDPIVDFTGLTDTPSSFVGQSGKYLQVNAAENSLEFVNPLFGTGSFVGFGGATVLIGLETAQPQQGWNDRQITQLQGHSGIKNLSLSNNEITLPAGKYLINAEGGVFRSKQTRIGIEFTAGDHAGQRFESRSNYAGSIVGNDQGGARGSVKTAVQSQNQMTFKVVSYVGESQSATTFEYAQTDVTVLDLGGDRDILSITGLFDTPTSYVGGSGKFLQVNNSEDAVQYSSLSGQISSQEIDWLAYSTISDLPSASEHHGMFAHVHSEGAAYMAHAGNWEKIYPVNGSSLTFTGLSDTPNVYDDGKILQSTADGLEWVDMPAGGGGGGGGGGGSTILPSGSILRKVSKSFPNIANLQTVGTTIAEFDFTPKALGSLVELEFTALYQENSQSQQQGRFKVDGQFTGGMWYQFHGSQSSSWGANTRTNLVHRASYETTGTATQNIAMELILDGLDPTDLTSIVMSAEEIAQSDFTLTGGGSSTAGGGFIHAVFNENANIVSKSSSWDTHVNSITFPQGSWNGYARINYKNAFASLPNVQVTADHIDGATTPHVFGQVQVQQLDRCDVVIGDVDNVQVQAGFSVTIFSDEIAGGGGGGSSNHEFCRAQVSSSSSIAHPEADVDLDINQLATDSKNWIHTDTTRNTVGILVPEDGLYDVSFNIRPVTAGNNLWRDNVSFLHTALQIVKADGTNILIQETREAKNIGNGTTLNNHLYLDNLSLDQGDFLYLRCRVYSNNTSLSWAIDDNFSFLSVSKSAGGGGGGGGGSVGGIGSDADVIAKSNFSEIIPDKINVPILRGTNLSKIQTRFFTFEGFFGRSTPSELIQYEMNIGGSERYSINFENNANGTWDSYVEVDNSSTSIDFSKIPSAITNKPTLKEFIDANRAIYLGGGSAGGGGSSTFAGLTDTPSALTEGSGQYLKVSDDGQTIEYVDLPAGGGDGSSPSTGSSLNNNDYIKDFSNFSGELPDSIIIRGAASTLDQVLAGRFYYINGTSSTDQIFYDFLNWRVGFNNDASGTNGSFYNRDSNTLHAGNSTWEFFDGATSLQEIIDNGDAIYYGGSSSSSDGADSVDDITDLPDNPADGQLVTVGCDLYIGCNGEWVKVGTDAVAPPSEAPACVSNLEEYNQYTEYKDQFLADNASTSFSAGLNNQTNIHDFVHDVCLFADSNLSQEQNTVVIDETTFKWGMFAGDQNINIRAQAFSGPNIGSCTFKEWRSDLPNFPKTNAQETVFIDRDASITGYFECTLAPDQPNCNQVALHLQPAAGETIADKSDNQHLVTTGGNTIADNTATLFGGGTMHFDGDGDYLTIGDAVAFKFLHDDTTDYTIELWYRLDQMNQFNHILGSIAASSSEVGVFLNVRQNGQLYYHIHRGQTSTTFKEINSHTGAISANTWNHIAFVNQVGQDLKLYLNGVSISDQGPHFTTVATPSTSNPESTLHIGATKNSISPGASGPMNGQIQDLRISKKAVYTGNFTPPTSLLANPCGFPGDQPTCSEVDFHLQASSGGTVEDKSDNNRTITNPNNVSNQSFIDNSETLFGESTLFFSTSRLLHFYPANFGSNDFTVEFWIKYDSPITTSTKDIIVTKGRDPTSTIELSITLNQDKLRLLNNLVLESTNTGMASVLNNWTHIAAVRSGNSIYLYVNGQREIDVAINGSVYASPYELEIGNKSYSGGWTNNLKHMQDFRISKKAVYTNNFISPTNLLGNSCAKALEFSSFSGWNYSTTFTSPATNAGGSNSKTFWNNSADHGLGYYHPSLTNKQNMIDGNPSTYAGDYLIKTYSTVVWEKIAINSNIDSGTATITFSLRATSAYSSVRRSPGFFLCWRRADQAFNGSRLNHYLSYGYNSSTHTYQRRAQRDAAIWDGGATEKKYTYNIDFTGGIAEIFLGVFQGKSGGCCWGMRIYEVSVSS